MENKFQGVGVALATPFEKDGSIDFIGLEHLLDYTSKGGVDYWVLCGTTGESATLSNDEKIDILEFAKENNPGNIPIVFGMGGNNTSQILKNIAATDFAGVDAILSVSPYYNKPSQSGLVKHYQTIADNCPVPVILYNVPGRTASNLLWETTVTLSKHTNIVGVKEASGNLEQCMRIHNSTNDGFCLISGDDLLTLPILSLGGVGVISVLANAFPIHFKNIVSNFKSGKIDVARETIFELLDLNTLMYKESNPVGIKEVLRQLDICKNHVRLPLETASESLTNEINLIMGSLNMRM